MPRVWHLNQETGHYWACEDGRYFARVGNVEMTWAQYQERYQDSASQPQPQRVPRVFPTADVGGHVSQRALVIGEGPSHYGPHQGTATAGQRRTQLPRRYSVASGSGSANPLDSRYMRRPSIFFIRHRVFYVYWHENAGDETSTSHYGITQDRQHGERIFSKHRRLVIIAVFDRHCIAVPIQTYKQQGVSKSGVEPSDHAIVYTGDNPGPSTLEKQQRVHEDMRAPIEVVRDDPQDMLDPYSRLNYSELYTVQFNAKVRPLGMIHPRSRPVFDQSSYSVLGSRMFPIPLQRMTAGMQQLHAQLSAAQAELRALRGETSTHAQDQRDGDEDDENDDAEDESEEEGSDEADDDE